MRVPHYMHKLVLCAAVLLIACVPQFEAVQIIDADESLDLEAVQSFEGYTIPDYYFAQLIEKEKKIKECLSKTEVFSTFIFFTDAHWETNYKHSPEIIRHIIQNTGISRVLFGGDAIVGNENKNKALKTGCQFNESFSFISDFYPVFGNHDSNRIPANISIPDSLFTSEEIIHYLFRNINNSYNICYGGDYYYYVDDLEHKTRYVCVDTGAYGISIAQANHIYEAFINTPAGWHIIINAHIIFNATDGNDINSLYLLECTKSLIQLVDSYNRRQKCLFYNSVEYDCSNAKGHIELIVGGHLHRDVVRKTSGGVPIIIADCDGSYTYSIVGSKEGTINEQCVTVVVLDYNNDLIHLVRIGRGDDMDVPMRKH